MRSPVQERTNNMNIKEYKTRKGELRYVTHQAYIGLDALTGKQIRKDVRGKTKKDVKLKIDRLKIQFEKNGNTDRKESLDLFSEIAERWFAQYKLGTKPNSQDVMRIWLDVYILPVFGQYKIEKITSVIVQRQVNIWATNATEPLFGKMHRKKGKGCDYKCYFNTVSRIFKYALSLGLCEINPCSKIQIPNVKIESTKKKIIFYNDKQRKIFFDFLETLPSSYYNNEFKIICRLLIATGLRIGEAMALSWSDIDFKERTLSVSKTTYYKTIQESPKTNSSRRIIYLDNQTSILLKNWWAFEKQHFMKFGAANQPLIFPNFKGEIRNYQNMRPLLYKCVKEAKVPNIGFHGFRHTHVSLLLKAGANFKEIQHRLGHATLAMTMDTYGHLEPTQEKDIVRQFAEVIDF